MGRGIKIPWIGVKIPWVGGQYANGRGGVKIPWVGGRYTMGMGLHIPLVGDPNTMGK